MKSTQTLFHRIEHGGFGAIISRLMTGLNISLALNANYTFSIDSPYQVEAMFDIDVKLPIELAQQQEILEWNFLRDTWNAPPSIKAEHQFPRSPLESCMQLSRHQWCAVLAKAIFGAPSSFLKNKIEHLKSVIHWDSYDLHIGLHVRKGDKISECPYVPTQSYLLQVANVIQDHPQKKILIFLSSDDPCTLDHIQSGLIGVDVRWDNSEARYNNFNAGMVANDSSMAHQESVTAAKNISLFGECDYVIGMTHAQFTWLGGLLAVFNNQLDSSRHIMLDPHTGLRGHWATHYGFPLHELL
jgi:hypothetical protein